MEKQINRIHPGTVLRRLVIAWLAAAALEYLLLSGQNRMLTRADGLAAMSLLRLAAVTAALFMALMLLGRKLGERKEERWLLAGVFAAYSALTLVSSFTWLYLAACLGITLMLAIYARFGWNDAPVAVAREEKRGGVWLWVTVFMAAGFFLFLGVWTLCRVWAFKTTTYDFGIFAQMFHNLKNTGLPVTTLERSREMSHFLVHVSPIVYLLLPVYWLLPGLAAVQLIQAAAMTAAVVPLWLLGKRHGMSPVQRTLLCAILLLSPAFSGGAAFDFHENCCLTALLLWLLYAIDSRKYWLTAVAAVLTLLVKEDAAVYVAVVGIFVLLQALLRKEDRRQWLTGIGLLCGAVGYFLGVSAWLNAYGEGVMSYRYENFMFSGSESLLSVILGAILCPLKVVYECVDAGKLEYILLTMLPLLGLPLLTRRYERLVLLIPYILVNLMSDYSYQHSLFFQYSFGSLACLVYLTAVNAAEIRIPWRKMAALVLAAVLGLGAMWNQILPVAAGEARDFLKNRDKHQQMIQLLTSIDGEASVASNTVYTPWLCHREQVYDIRYSENETILSCDYVVLCQWDTFGLGAFATETQTGLEACISLLEENGYTLWREMDGELTIYVKMP